MSGPSAYIGIDNGVTGSIGVIVVVSGTAKHMLFRTPCSKAQDYTKKIQNISRVSVPKLRAILLPYSSMKCNLLLERPMVNSTRFTATKSALRCHEATLIVLEELEIPHEFIDSKEWQSALLPAGTKGSELLKKAGVQVSKRLFPSLPVGKDADGILIAEYCRCKHQP